MQMKYQSASLHHSDAFGMYHYMHFLIIRKIALLMLHVWMIIQKQTMNKWSVRGQTSSPALASTTNALAAMSYCPLHPSFML